jgi:methionyl-tRNA formyltransferase
MSVSRFILVGEDVFARKVGEIITADARGKLVHIYTTTERENTLTRFASANDVEVSDSQLLSSADAPKLEADWLINVNSSLLLPDHILDQFPGRALNLHNGQLPEYAGRHVHQWAIRDGRDESAATIHFMASGVDTGDIVCTKAFDISPDDTGLSVFKKSFEVGVEAFADVLLSIFSGQPLPRHRQNTANRTNFRHKDALDPRICWNQTMRQILDFVRSGNYRPLKSPTYSASFIGLQQEITVFKAVAHDGFIGKIGEIKLLEDTPVVICNNGGIAILDATVENRKVLLEDWQMMLPSNARHILPVTQLSTRPTPGEQQQ